MELWKDEKKKEKKKSLSLFWLFSLMDFFYSFSCRFVVICCILAALSQYHHHHSSLLPIEWSYGFSHSTNSDGTGIASLSHHIEFIFYFSRKKKKKKKKKKNNIYSSAEGNVRVRVCVRCILGMWKHITTLLYGIRRESRVRLYIEYTCREIDLKGRVGIGRIVWLATSSGADKVSECVCESDHKRKWELNFPWENNDVLV